MMAQTLDSVTKVLGGLFGQQANGDGVASGVPASSLCTSDSPRFEDPDFPAEGASLYFTQSKRELCDYEWKRAIDIAENPKFFAKGAASRFDVKEESLTERWMLAVWATLSQNEALLLHRVAPEEKNSFEEGSYDGSFHFQFWRYGSWVEVVVDDRLPVTSDGELAFMKPVESDDGEATEFGAALLYKAMAKLYGSYEAIESVHPVEAFVGFTGGISEFLNLEKDSPSNMFDILEESVGKGSLVSATPILCSDQAVVAVAWVSASNAYFVTGVKSLTKEDGRRLELLRVRSPVGTTSNWLDKWSDKLKEWEGLLEGLEEEGPDGEFWVSYDHFKLVIQEVEIYHLPDGPSGEEYCKEIEGEGKWEKGTSVKNKGEGEEEGEDLITGSPHCITLQPEATTDAANGDKVPVLLSLSRKYMFSTPMSTDQIGFRMHSSDHDFEKKSVPSAALFWLPHVSVRLFLPPGDYTIVPVSKGEGGEYHLRVYTFKAKLTAPIYLK